MDIRTYRAPSLQEALQFVRQELGPDAAILQTRQVNSGLMGMLGRRIVEVQASLEVPVARRFSRVSRGGVTEPLAPVEASSPPDCDSPELLQRSNSNALEFDPLHKQPHGPPLSAAMLETLTDLLDADVAPELARDLMQQISQQYDQPQLCDPWLVKSRLCQLIGQQLRVSGPIVVQSGQQRIVALVGPTGVGKTTTLAKLAAGFHIEQGCQVGLISLDVFRVGAIDQLRQYADLIPAPIEVVSSPDQLPAAIGRLSSCELVLLDTAGRSPNDTEQISILGAFLRVCRSASVHLVLSAASSPTHARASLESFAQLEPTHLLLTKLDEAMSLGSWLPVLSQAPLPLSYLTTGQRVPDDILVANCRRLASLIVGQAKLG